MVHTLNVCLLRWLVDDSAVLQASQIKHADTTIGATADEHINAVGTESNVKHFLVMSNQLCLGCQGRNIPDCAGCVDAGCDD